MDKFKKRYDIKSKELKSLNSEHIDIKNRIDFIEGSLKNALVRKKKIEEQINASKDYIELYEVAIKETNELREELSNQEQPLKDNEEPVEVVVTPEVEIVEDVEVIHKDETIKPLEVFYTQKMTFGNKKSVDAKLAKIDDRYVVLKGSLIDKEVDVDTAKWYRMQNRAKIDDGYKLTESIPFNYLETATSFVLGYSSSGKQDWINEETNETLGQFYGLD